MSEPKPGSRTLDPVTGLTANQEKFCVELAKNSSPMEAYKAAYHWERMKPATISRTAHELQSNPKVAARLAQLRADARVASGITLEEHLKTLGVLRNLASKEKQYSAAIAAETNRGKVSGLYVERKEVSGPGGSPVQVDNRTVIEFVKP